MYHSQFSKESKIVDAPQDFVVFKPCNNTLMVRLTKQHGGDGVKKEYKYPQWKFPGKILELNPETQQIEKRKQYTPNYFVGMLKQIQPKNTSLATLAAQLTHFEQHDVVIMRGSLHENLATAKPFFPEYGDINRRIKNEYKDKDGTIYTPTLKETAKTWAMFDLDGCACDAGVEEMFADPGAVIDAHIQKYLPEPFRGVSYYYQLSASWGLSSKPPFNCHLWFVLNRPMTNEELRTYVKQLPKTDHCKLDHAVFNCVQPYFICPPKFDDSIDANHPIRLVKRSGLITNAKETLELPAIVVNTPAQAPASSPGKTNKPLQGTSDGSSLFTTLNKLKWATEGGRHEAIVNAGYTLSFYVNAEVLSYETALSYAHTMLDSNPAIKPNEKRSFKQDMTNSLNSALAVNKKTTGVDTQFAGYRFNYLALLDNIPTNLTTCGSLIKEFIDGEMIYLSERKRIYIYDKEEGCYVSNSRTNPLHTLMMVAGFVYNRLNDVIQSRIEDDEAYLTELQSEKQKDEELIAETTRSLKTYKGLHKTFTKALVNEGAVAFINRVSTVHLSVSINDFDTNPQLINFTNGYLDLSTSKFIEHENNPNRPLFLKSTGYAYDPKQTSPFWDRAVDIWAGEGNAENAFFIKKALGYTLSGVKQNKVFFFIHAPKDSGKTTFMRAISAALGTYTAELNPDAWIQDFRQNRDERRKLVGARFAWSDEVYHEFGKGVDTAFLKTLTGGASIEVSCKYESPITFTPQATPYILSNDALKVPPGDDAFWQRARCIKLDTVPYGKRMRFEFTDQLKQAIFNWLLAGYHECLSSNDLFEAPQSYKEALLNYRQEGNHVDEFIDDFCVVDPSARVGLDQLYDVYADFVKTNNYKRYAKKRFIRIIQSLHSSVTIKRPQGIGKRPFVVEGLTTIEIYQSPNFFTSNYYLNKKGLL